TVLVADNNGGLTTQDVTITITGTNDVPVIGGVSIGDVTEDVNIVAGNISTSGALTIADVDAGQSNFTAQASTPGSNGFVTFLPAATAAWSYTTNNTPAATQHPYATLFRSTILVADNNDGLTTQVVTITIPGTNDVPVIGGVSTGDVTEDINVIA